MIQASHPLEGGHASDYYLQKEVEEDECNDDGFEEREQLSGKERHH